MLWGTTHATVKEPLGAFDHNLLVERQRHKSSSHQRFEAQHFSPTHSRDLKSWPEQIPRILGWEVLYEAHADNDNAFPKSTREWLTDTSSSISTILNVESYACHDSSSSSSSRGKMGGSLFNNLPTDLRLTIWEFALPGPRIVQKPPKTYCCTRVDPDNAVGSCFGNGIPTFHDCSEAMHELLEDDYPGFEHGSDQKLRD